MTASPDIAKLLGGTTKRQRSWKRLVLLVLVLLIINVVLYTAAAFAIAWLAGFNISLRVAIAAGWVLAIIADKPVTAS